MNKITKEELLNSTAHGLTMKDLRRFINNNPQISDDAPVMVERVEDKYFNGVDISGMQGDSGVLPKGSKSEGWKVLLVEGYGYWNASQFNDKMYKEIENRKLGKGEYSEKLNPKEAIVELTDDLKEQFFPSFCITKSTDDRLVYIYNHY